MRDVTSCLLVVLLGTLGVSAQEFEQPPILSARQLLAPELLEGPHHRVDDEVLNDGLMNHFVIHSDFGEFTATSEAMLVQRLQEVQALVRLQEISRMEVFAGALKDTAMKPVEAVKNVFTDPGGTAKAIPRGIGRAFRGMYYKGRKLAHEVGDKIDEAKDREPEDGEDEESGLTKEEVVEKTEKVAKSLLGYNAAFRDLARKLRVDPYTSNEVLRRELDRLASAALGAGLSFRAIAPSLKVVGYVEDINELVYSVSGSELERRSDKALGGMGIKKSIRLDFFENRYFTPTLETELVESLRLLERVAGREHIIALACEADSEEEARFFLGVARILAHYHREVSPLSGVRLAGLDEAGRLIAGVDGTGRLVVPVAVDYLTWRPGMEREGPLYAFKERELRLSGRISQRAETEFRQRGWRVEIASTGSGIRRPVR